MNPGFARDHRVRRPRGRPTQPDRRRGAINHRLGKAARASQRYQARRADNYAKPLGVKRNSTPDGGGKRRELADRNKAHTEDTLSTPTLSDQPKRRHGRERGKSSSATDSRTGANKPDSDQGSQSKRSTQGQPTSGISPGTWHQPTARAITLRPATNGKTQHHSPNPVVC